MDIDNFVMPLFRANGDTRSFAGTAFCIDGYLITAAHVLDRESTFYALNGSHWIPLEYSRWLPKQPATVDKHGFDVAFYPVPALRSPLSLADADAEPHDEMDIVCWQWRPDGLRQVATRGLVLEENDEKGYIRLATVDKITHGSSGCPIFRDGKVFGIMAMGRDFVETKGLPPLPGRLEQNTCWAFKASHIRRLMPDERK
ncbi:MAG: trypsin-like peptidase domain-containing protein [Muribaculaceae bacterium]|nr:trypsin-like peptidase domain-containing protein [Muribaculaceae bacterium]